MVGFGSVGGIDTICVVMCGTVSASSLVEAIGAVEVASTIKTHLISSTACCSSLIAPICDACAFFLHTKVESICTEILNNIMGNHN